MSSYPPGGDYDERLLDSAPKATRAEKQEGYNVNLLASDNSETPMNARPPTVDGHASLEAANPPTKESYDSSYSIPWYRQKKWRIIMFVAAILVIGAVVGGAVGGTVASNNKGPKPGGQITLSITSSGAPSATAAPLDPTSDLPLPPGSSSLPRPTGTSTDAGVISTVRGTGGGVNNNLALPTPTQGSNPNDGRQGAAPVIAWSD